MRRRNITTIKIDGHLRRLGDSWIITFAENETKTGAALEFPWPEILLPCLEYWLGRWRPILLQRTGRWARPIGKAFWVSSHGSPMTQQSIYDRIVKRTREAFGNFSVYGVVDQMVWRQPDGPRSVGVFARAMGAPADRNLIDASLNAGVSLKAPMPGRDNDTVGVGYGWAHVSGQASALDQDTATFNHTAFPVRSAEHFVEVTYQYQAAPWWQLQPDFQYVINPGGGIQNPQHTSQTVGDEAVFGLRTTITF